MKQSNQKEVVYCPPHDFEASFWHGRYCRKCGSTICGHGKIVPVDAKEEYMTAGMYACKCGIFD